MTPPQKDDPVNPKHYANFGEWAAIVIIRRWNSVRKALGVEPVSFNVGTAVKYLQRAGLKPGEAEIQDVAKAEWYLRNRLHELDPATYLDPAGVDCELLADDEDE